MNLVLDIDLGRLKRANAIRHGRESMQLNIEIHFKTMSPNPALAKSSRTARCKICKNLFKQNVIVSMSIREGCTLYRKKRCHVRVNATT